MSSISTDWQRRRKAAAEANRLNKSIVFDALQKTGITHVTVGFDGEGDQGQMERAVARRDETPVEFPELTLALHAAAWGSAETGLRELPLRDAVEELCYGYLEQQHDGWEINDGSFGKFVLDVAERTLTLDYYWRVTDAEHSTYSY